MSILVSSLQNWAVNLSQRSGTGFQESTRVNYFKPWWNPEFREVVKFDIFENVWSTPRIIPCRSHQALHTQYSPIQAFRTADTRRCKSSGPNICRSALLGCTRKYLRNPQDAYNAIIRVSVYTVYTLKMARLMGKVQIWGARLSDKPTSLWRLLLLQLLSSRKLTYGEEMFGKTDLICILKLSLWYPWTSRMLPWHASSSTTRSYLLRSSLNSVLAHQTDHRICGHMLSRLQFVCFVRPRLFHVVGITGPNPITNSIPLDIILACVKSVNV